ESFAYRSARPIVDLTRNDDPLPAPGAMLPLSSPEAPTYQRQTFVIPMGISDTPLRSDGYANAHHRCTESSRPWCKGGTAIRRSAIARRRIFLIPADGARRSLT